ncbi:MAG: hypothetical protein KKH72_14135 [Alphaproteobacteria bacterium]|nr:hypothetical protein [Alphaproteobacteria bacterium]
MNANSSHRRRIVRFSAAMSVICAVLMPVGPFVLFFLALLAPIDTLAAMAGVAPLQPGSVDAADGARLLFGIFALASALPLSFGLIRLAACFGGFARGALFAPSTIAGLRDFAGAMLVWTLAQPLFRAAYSMILTFGGPEGSRQIVVQIGSDFILMSVFALCVLIVSWVLTEASALSEENAQFV